MIILYDLITSSPVTSLQMPKLIEESKQGLKSSFVPHMGLLSNNHSYFQKKKRMVRILVKDAGTPGSNLEKNLFFLCLVSTFFSQ